MVKRNEKEVDKMMGRCFLWSDVRFNNSKNNPFYQTMFVFVVIFIRLKDLRQSLEFIGCTVIFDGSMDQNGRTFLNFLVHCLEGTMFIKYMDASAHIIEAPLLCES